MNAIPNNNPTISFLNPKVPTENKPDNTPTIIPNTTLIDVSLTVSSKIFPPQNKLNRINII